MLKHQPKSLSNRSQAGRGFVGRAAELAVYRGCLERRQPGLSVLYVHGLGGVGKSALLREYAAVAADRGMDVVFVDARLVDPSPAGFLVSLRDVLGLDAAASPISDLRRRDRLVLLIDSYELLASNDDWIRDAVVAPLTNRAVIVIAGRATPSISWTADLQWRSRVRAIALHNLTPDDSRSLLTVHRVPPSRQPSVLEFTSGHPLALVLVGDVIAADPSVVFSPDRMPNVVQALLERIVAQTPSDDHRRCLELCAHVRVTTETLIRALVSESRAHFLFEWLRRLSFMESGPEGVFPHDVARAVLDADFRWRDPDAYAQMHRRIWRYLLVQLRGTNGRQQQRVFFDKLYLHRFNPTGARYHDFGTLGGIFAEPAAARDHAAIRAVVRRHEGEASERIAAHWLQRQPGAFHVIRGVDGGLLGFVGTIAIHECSPEDFAADPGTAAAVGYARRYGPARAGEELLYHRFYMSTEEYQDVSAATNLLALMVTTMPALRSRLAWSFISLAAPDVYRDIMAYINFSRAPEADFAAGDRTYGTFAHDWRAQPFAEWWELEAERSMSRDAPAVVDQQRRPALAVLSQSEFDAAVRRALRDLADLHVLAASPLLRSRVLRDSAAAPMAADLQTLLRDAIGQLNTTPRGEKFYKALWHTYVAAAGSQERCAERLGVPFSTYRYHLARGTEHLVATLWRRELYGNE